MTIIDKMLAVRKKIYACFIEYEKAFDENAVRSKN